MDSPLRPSNRPTWSCLDPGAGVDIVKLSPDGSEVARYPGRILASPESAEWIVAEAAWTRDILQIDRLKFAPGDRLIEYFSPSLPFNAFAVYSPGGSLRGWYANVTWPSWMDLNSRPVIYWHDLYIDLIGMPDGGYSVLDEDELAAAELRADVMTLIGNAQTEMIRRFLSRTIPFVDRYVRFSRPN